MALFHHFHKRSSNFAFGRSIFPSPPEDKWPKEWKTIYYKTYPGVPLLPLPFPSLPEANFFDLVANRRSVRGQHREGVSQNDLSLTLRYSCGQQDILRNPKNIKLRAQPSGGGRFPIEMYVLALKRENEIPPGVYHYDVRKHALETLRLRDFTDKDITKLFTYPWANNCSLVLVLTAIFHRTAMKYGERAYRYALIEAGHIGQGVYLAGASCNIGVSSMGGTHDERLHALLDIDGTQESIVYALMLSK